MVYLLQPDRAAYVDISLPLTIMNKKVWSMAEESVVDNTSWKS